VCVGEGTEGAQRAVSRGTLDGGLIRRMILGFVFFPASIIAGQMNMYS